MRIRQTTIGAFAFASYTAMSVLLAVGVLLIGRTLTTERESATEQAELKSIARLLEESSDVLTQSCRRYVVTGEARHLHDYWAEVETTRRREHALERLEASGAPRDEFTLLERAKRQSDAIIPRESRAMRLVHEAKGIPNSDLPAFLAAVALSPEEKSLPVEAKMAEARRILFAIDLENDQHRIKGLIEEFERRVDARVDAKAGAARSQTARALSFLMTLPFLIPIGMGAILGLLQWLVGAPIARYIRTIQRHDQNGAPSLPVQGTEELRRLAEELNRQFAINERQRCELATANESLNVLATTDGLTGVANRRAFGEALARESKTARETGVPFSLVLLDVDRFKAFNDEFGHPAGDEVLRSVAATLGMSARGTDFVARYGGEEFAIVLPNTDAASAAVVAERVRRAIEVRAWPVRPITVSVGVATMESYDEDGDTLLARVDEALYASKAGGRNRVTHRTSLPRAA